MVRFGGGESIWKWAHDGDEVDVCIMCAEAKARAFRPSDAELEGDTDVAVSFFWGGARGSLRGRSRTLR